jgi:hypothetical protein
MLFLHSAQSSAIDRISNGIYLPMGSFRTVCKQLLDFFPFPFRLTCRQIFMDFREIGSTVP